MIGVARRHPVFSGGAAAFATLVLLACSSSRGVEVSYGPAPVTLTGEIVRWTVADSSDPKLPGERPASYWLLRLGTPVSLVGGIEPIDEPERNVRELQLVLSAEQYHEYGALVGCPVVATGTLFHAHTAHHHRPVLMQVTRIRPVARGSPH